MKPRPQSQRQAHQPGPLAKRLVWFVTLWLAGVALIGLAIRAALL